MACQEAAVSCAEWHERIALDDPGAEEHLAVCAACREFERDMRAVDIALASLRQVDESALAQMRSTVLSKLRSRRRWMALVPVAAMVAALLFGWTLQRLRVEPLPFRAPTIAAVQPAPLPPAQPRRERSPAPARARVEPAEHEQVVVTLFTEDPDVVIVWISD
jgi:hypothetical protein